MTASSPSSAHTVAHTYTRAHRFRLIVKKKTKEGRGGGKETEKKSSFFLPPLSVCAVRLETATGPLSLLLLLLCHAAGRGFFAGPLRGEGPRLCLRAVCCCCRCRSAGTFPCRASPSVRGGGDRCGAEGCVLDGNDAAFPSLSLPACESVVLGVGAAARRDGPAAVVAASSAEAQRR